MKERWLDAELATGAESRHRQAGPAADGRAPHPPAGLDGGLARDGLIDEVADIGQHDGHIEAVGAESQDAAIAKEERLDDQGHRDTHGGDLRPQDHGDQSAAHGVGGGPARHWHIEHHDDEGERGQERDKGHVARRHLLAQAAHAAASRRATSR